jgi:hypothetical protein
VLDAVFGETLIPLQVLQTAGGESVSVEPLSQDKLAEHAKEALERHGTDEF